MSPTFVNDVQPEKAYDSTVVTEHGIATVVNATQSLNARRPMVVTDDGIVKLFTVFLSIPHSFQESVNLVGNENGSAPMMVAVPSGMSK